MIKEENISKEPTEHEIIGRVLFFPYVIISGFISFVLLHTILNFNPLMVFGFWLCSFIAFEKLSKNVYHSKFSTRLSTSETENPEKYNETLSVHIIIALTLSLLGIFYQLFY